MAGNLKNPWDVGILFRKLSVLNCNIYNFTGKKGKKGKGKTVSLNDFLSTGNANGGTDTTTVVIPSASW